MLNPLSFWVTTKYYTANKLNCFFHPFFFLTKCSHNLCWKERKKKKQTLYMFEPSPLLLGHQRHFPFKALPYPSLSFGKKFSWYCYYCCCFFFYYYYCCCWYCYCSCWCCYWLLLLLLLLLLLMLLLWLLLLKLVIVIVVVEVSYCCCCCCCCCC